MSPELVLVLRIALLSAVVVGLEFAFSYRAQRSQRFHNRSRAARFVQPDPVVRFRVTAPTARRSATKQVEADTLQPLNPIVRLEPFPHKTDYVTEKRAA